MGIAREGGAHWAGDAASSYGGHGGWIDYGSNKPVMPGTSSTGDRVVGQWSRAEILLVSSRYLGPLIPREPAARCDSHHMCARPPLDSSRPCWLSLIAKADAATSRHERWSRQRLGGGLFLPDGLSLTRILRTVRVPRINSQTQWEVFWLWLRPCGTFHLLS